MSEWMPWNLVFSKLQFFCAISFYSHILQQDTAESKWLKQKLVVYPYFWWGHLMCSQICKWSSRSYKKEESQTQGHQWNNLNNVLQTLIFSHAKKGKLGECNKLILMWTGLTSPYEFILQQMCQANRLLKTNSKSTSLIHEHFTQQTWILE